MKKLDKVNTTIWIIGLLVIINGIRIILFNYCSTIHLFNDYSSIVDSYGMGFYLLSVLSNVLLPTCFILGGIGFMMMKSWGRILLILSLLVDVLLSTAGFIKNTYYEFVVKHPSDVVNVHGTVNILPLYLITIAEIFVLYLIIRKLKIE